MENVLLAEAQELNAPPTENQKKFIQFLNRGEPNYEKYLLENHNKRIVKILNNEIIPPYEVEIQPSSVCNLNCKHCFGKCLTTKKLENKMNKKSMKTIAERIDKYKKGDFEIETVKFCGTTSDPLANKSIIYGIELFKDLGKKIIAFTNGLYLDKKYQGKKYLDFILCIDLLNLSLDAGSEEMFRQLKGREGFGRIINSLEEIVQKRNGHPKINVSYVIGKDNYHEIVKTAELAGKIGVDELRFRVDFTNAKDIHRLSKLILPLLHKAKGYSRENFKVFSPYSENEIKQDDSVFNSFGKKCFTQQLWACIGPDCNLYACGHRTYSGVMPFGNLLKQSFQEIWEGEERKKSLEYLPDEHCKFCSPFSSRANDFMTFLSGVHGEVHGRN